MVWLGLCLFILTTTCGLFASKLIPKGPPATKRFRTWWDKDPALQWSEIDAAIATIKQELQKVFDPLLDRVAVLLVKFRK